jgi:WD40 repeat protein
MSLIDDLVCLKQKTIRDFLVSGGKKRNGQHIEFSFIENDPRKLCHPLRTILHPDIKMMSSLAHSMNEICALRLKESDVIIKQPTSQYDMSNTKGINSVAFDCEGLYFSLSGPGGIVRVYDFEESDVAIELR